MKNIILYVCDIMPESDAECKQSRAAVGIDYNLCAKKDKCPNKVELKNHQRTRNKKENTVAPTVEKEVLAVDENDFRTA